MVAGTLYAVGGLPLPATTGSNADCSTTACECATAPSGCLCSASGNMDVHRYDARLGVWVEMFGHMAETTSYRPAARHGHTTVVHEGTLWVYGGCGASHKGATCLDDLLRFDLASASWALIEQRAYNQVITPVLV